MQFINFKSLSKEKCIVLFMIPRDFGDSAQTDAPKEAIMSEFEIFVSKADFKFNCAHFIIFNGFRERLHGHNYQLSVKVIGDGSVGPDGYLIDFGDIKKATRALCKNINEYFICPTRSPNMKIEKSDNEVRLECDDGARFCFPSSDCLMLPLFHSSAEELALYFYCEIIRRIGLKQLHERGIKVMEVTVAEAVNQCATYRSKVPLDEAELARIEDSALSLRPKPCFDTEV